MNSSDEEPSAYVLTPPTEVITAVEVAERANAVSRRGRLKNVITPEVVEVFFDDLIEGIPLHDAVKKTGCTYMGMMKVINKNEELLARYKHAMSVGVVHEGLRKLAESEEQVDPARGRLMADNAKWLMTKLAPALFADRAKMEHSGGDGGPIVLSWLPPQQQ